MRSLLSIRYAECSEMKYVNSDYSTGSTQLLYWFELHLKVQLSLYRCVHRGSLVTSPAVRSNEVATGGGWLPPPLALSGSGWSDPLVLARSIVNNV